MVYAEVVTPLARLLPPELPRAFRALPAREREWRGRLFLMIWAVYRHEAYAWSAALADEPPERWGERILALRRAGKADEADALLAEFRKRYPGHPVPDAWLR